MKYVYTTMITIALVFLPTVSVAAERQVVKLIPIEQYAQTSLQQFSDFLQRPDLTNAELSEALEDISLVLHAYARSLN